MTTERRNQDPDIGPGGDDAMSTIKKHESSRQGLIAVGSGVEEDDRLNTSENGVNALINTGRSLDDSVI